MPYKNTHKSTLLVLKHYVRALDKCLIQKSNSELLDIIKVHNSESEKAKTLLIYRFIPKILKESRKIFNNHQLDCWNREDVIQTGIKALLYAIQDFLKKEKDQQSEAFFIYIASFYIIKYLNRKKINYDPLIQFNKGAEFKKVFYKYFKVLRNLINENNNSQRVCEKLLCSKLETNIETLREVQFVHKQVSVIKSQEDRLSSFRNIDGNDGEKQNYIDYAICNNWISEDIVSIANPEELVAKNEPRNIMQYKKILSTTEYKFLDLLNSGETKEDIFKRLKISKQRFSFLKNNITKKIKKFQTGIY